MNRQDYDNVRDDEVIFIGGDKGRNTNGNKPHNRPKWRVLVIVLIVLVAVALAVVCGRGERPTDEDQTGLFEESIETKSDSLTTVVTEDPDSCGVAYSEKIDTLAADVPLTLYIPHCAVPELSVGAPEEDKSEYVLAAQAADIRADNREILGSFVLKGDVLAQGISKKGFCAIIDGRITIGVAENTDLFDKAVETEGYFFRQYPLVDNGVPVDNNLKSATVRKALCSKGGEIFIAVSQDDMTMQDFAATLAAFGVDNAIYLVGSASSYGWYIPEEGEAIEFSPNVHRRSYRNESYIRWRKAE